MVEGLMVKPVSLTERITVKEPSGSGVVFSARDLLSLAGVQVGNQYEVRAGPSSNGTARVLDAYAAQLPPGVKDVSAVDLLKLLGLQEGPDGSVVFLNPQYNHHMANYADPHPEGWD